MQIYRTVVVLFSALAIASCAEKADLASNSAPKTPDSASALFVCSNCFIQLLKDENYSVVARDQQAVEQRLSPGPYFATFKLCEKVRGFTRVSVYRTANFTAEAGKIYHAIYLDGGGLGANEMPFRSSCPQQIRLVETISKEVVWISDY